MDGRLDPFVLTVLLTPVSMFLLLGLVAPLRRTGKLAAWLSIAGAAVTFGAALGITAGRAVTIGRGNHRFALAPAAVPGGGAVSLTWIGRP